MSNLPDYDFEIGPITHQYRDGRHKLRIRFNGQKYGAVVDSDRDLTDQEFRGLIAFALTQDPMPELGLYKQIELEKL